jgi:hypothetical protein
MILSLLNIPRPHNTSCGCGCNIPFNWTDVCGIAITIIIGNGAIGGCEEDADDNDADGCCGCGCGCCRCCTLDVLVAVEVFVIGTILFVLLSEDVEIDDELPLVLVSVVVGEVLESDISPITVNDDDVSLRT